VTLAPPAPRLVFGVALSLVTAGLNVGCLRTDYLLKETQGSEGGTAGLGGSMTTGGSTAGTPAACDTAYELGTNFQVCAATYFGSTGEDALRAAAVVPGGDVIVAGSTDIQAFEAPTLSVENASGGVVLRLDGGGRAITAVARVAGSISDLEVSLDRAYLATDAGLSVLSSRLDELVWQSAELGAVTRVAVSGETIVALTADRRALLLDTSGQLLVEVPLPEESTTDVAVHETLGLFFVTGFHAARAGATCTGSMPFVRAYDFAGGLRWKAYDFDDAPSWCAASRGRRLALSPDGKLFYAGEQRGGNSVHLRDPQDLDAQAPAVAYDEFSNGSGPAIRYYTYLGRFDAETGKLETGQVILPRQDGVGGELYTSALSVDQAGQVLLGGQVTCCLEARDERRFAGQRPGVYSAIEASLMILSADLRQRKTWTTFTGSGPSGANVEAVAWGSGTGVAVVSASSDAGSLLTYEARQPEPGGGQDGYWVTFPAPP